MKTVKTQYEIEQEIEDRKEDRIAEAIAGVVFISVGLLVSFLTGDFVSAVFCCPIGLTSLICAVVDK